MNTRRAPQASRLLSSLFVALLFSLAAQTAAAQGAAGDGFLRVALPPGGEVRVENRRGGVSVEVWGEDAVGVAVSADKPARKSARAKSPLSIERSEELLAFVVARGATAAARTRVDLRVRVPAGAHLKLFTSEGEIEVSGLPLSLSAQTVSGDLSVGLPQPLDASVTAQSLNGAVTLGVGADDSADAAPREVRGKFQTRWGAGSRAVNLFSGRGRIRLAPLSREAQEAAARSTPPGPPRIDDPRDGEPSAPVRRPTPQPAETPQEVDEEEVVRVESDLVTLNISVVDRASGRGLAGLAQADFRLAEDNVEQEIAHFEAADAPFDLLLLIDLSGSTAKVTDIIRAAALRFVAATRPRDRVAVLTFASETDIVSPLTDDRRALREALSRMRPPTGDTRLYDALAGAMTYLERESAPTRRRAIVMMSDGLDSTMPNVTGVGSRLPYAEVLDRAREFDGLLYTIWTSTEYEAFSPEDIQPETFDLAHDRTKEFADAGGGAFYLVERMEDLAGAYERVVADLGTVYSLSYRPTNKQRDGSWRAIRVRLPRHAGAVARGKRGYYAK